MFSETVFPLIHRSGRFKSVNRTQPIMKKKTLALAILVFIPLPNCFHPCISRKIHFDFRWAQILCATSVETRMLQRESRNDSYSGFHKLPSKISCKHENAFFSWSKACIQFPSSDTSCWSQCLSNNLRKMGSMTSKMSYRFVFMIVEDRETSNKWRA